MSRFRVDDGVPFVEGHMTTVDWFARAKGLHLPTTKDGEDPVALCDPVHEEAAVHPDPAPVIPAFASERGPSVWSMVGAALFWIALAAAPPILGILLSGCSSVSQAEYRALVEAATSYRDAVAPTFRASVENDPQLSERSKKSRLALDDDFQSARPSWEKRAGIAAKPPECPDDEMLTGPPVCIGPCRFFWFGPHVHEGAVVRVLR